ARPAAGLQAMLAGLRDLADAQRPPDPERPAEDLLPGWDLAPPLAAPVPFAQPVSAEVPVPLAQPVAPGALPAEPLSVPLALPVDVPLAQPVTEASEEPPTAILPRVVLPPCPCCQAPRVAGQAYCGVCGFIFPDED